MIKRSVLSITCLVLLIITSSFQADKNPSIVGKWQATSLEISGQDSVMQAQMKSKIKEIDALKSVDSKMAAHYKTHDLNTIKKLAKEEAEKVPELTKEQMKETAKNISIELMSTGNAYSSFTDKRQNIKWYLGDHDKKLFLDPFEVPNEISENSRVEIFDIISITDNALQLRVHGPFGENAIVNLIKVN
jgi:LytS/YehU family sensor histidine kinase